MLLHKVTCGAGECGCFSGFKSLLPGMLKLAKSRGKTQDAISGIRIRHAYTHTRRGVFQHPLPLLGGGGGGQKQYAHIRMNECEHCALWFDGDEDDDLCAMCLAMYIADCFRPDPGVRITAYTVNHEPYLSLAQSMGDSLVIFQDGE